MKSKIERKKVATTQKVKSKKCKRIFKNNFFKVFFSERHLAERDILCQCQLFLSLSSLCAD